MMEINPLLDDSVKVIKIIIRSGGKEKGREVRY